MTNPIFTIVQETKVYRKRVRRVAEVFVNVKDRPLFDTESGGILRDIIWRQEHAAPVKENVVKAWVAKQLNIPAELLIVTYNRNCGCTMCPCSPGYEVKLKRSKVCLLVPMVRSFDVEVFDGNGNGNRTS